MNVSRRSSTSIRALMSVRTAIDDRSPCDSKVLTANSTGIVEPSRRLGLAGAVLLDLGRSGVEQDSSRVRSWISVAE